MFSDQNFKTFDSIKSKFSTSNVAGIHCKYRYEVTITTVARTTPFGKPVIVRDRWQWRRATARHTPHCWRVVQSLSLWHGANHGQQKNQSSLNNIIKKNNILVIIIIKYRQLYISDILNAWSLCYLFYKVVAECSESQGQDVMAAGDDRMELQVWKGDWGLPSIDPNCLAVLVTFDEIIWNVLNIIHWDIEHVSFWYLEQTQSKQRSTFISQWHREKCK